MSADPPERPAEGDSIARNTAYSFATQMVTAAFTAALTIYLTRALGPDDFGLFALAASIGTLLLLPSDFGISQSVARFVAERREGPRDAVAAVVSEGLRLKLIAGLAVSALLFALAGPIASAYGEPGLGWPIRWVSIAVFGQSLVAYCRYAFLALRRASVGFAMVFSESAVEAGASVALVILGAGAAGAAAGRAIGYGVGMAIALALTARALGRGALAVRSGEPSARRRIATYAGALLVIDAAYSAMTQVDAILIGAVLSATSVGLFTAVLRLMTFLTYPGLSVANSVAPLLARGAGQMPGAGAFGAALRWLIVLGVLMAVPLLVWAEPIVDLVLGPEYEESSEVMRALAGLALLGGVAPLVSTGVNYLGEARQRIPIALGTLAFGVASALILLQTVGLLGAAYSAIATSALYVGGHLWILQRLVGLPLRPLALSLVRSLLAGAAMAAALAAFGTQSLSPLEWAGGGIAGLAAFGVVLAASGELRPEDVRAWASRLRRGVG